MKKITFDDFKLVGEFKTDLGFAVADPCTAKHNLSAIFFNHLDGNGEWEIFRAKNTVMVVPKNLGLPVEMKNFNLFSVWRQVGEIPVDTAQISVVSLSNETNDDGTFKKNEYSVTTRSDGGYPIFKAFHMRGPRAVAFYDVSGEGLHKLQGEM
jgi:hypothetical protein